MPKYEADSLQAGYCEYLTPTDATPTIRLARVGIVASAVVLTLAMLVLTLNTIPAVSFMLGVIFAFCAWFAFQFTKIEYEYTVATGVFELSKIYGARMRKKVTEFKTSEIVSVFPTERLAEYADRADVLYTCRKNDPYAVGLLYTVGSSHHVLVLSAPDKTIKCLKHYRRSAFDAAVLSNAKTNDGDKESL